MRDKFNYFTRWLGTAFGFISFALGGLVLSLILVPLLSILIRDQVKRARSVRLLIHKTFKLHIAALVFLGVLTQKKIHFSSLKQPGLLVIANHPTLLDIVFLISFIPNAICVVRDSLRKNLFFGFLIRSAGYVSNKNPADLVAQCASNLNAKTSIVIFPEGTRTNRQGPKNKLRRGAAYIALKTSRSLTPIYISCEPPTLSKAEKWYQIPEKKMHYTFTKMADITLPKQSIESAPNTLYARTVTHEIDKILFRRTSI